MSAIATSVEPTLRKLGAHLRWLIEKSGVNAEEVTVSIGVKSIEEQSLLISTLLREFDPASMKRHDNYPQMVEIHGVKLWVLVSKAKESA